MSARNRSTRRRLLLGLAALAAAACGVGNIGAPVEGTVFVSIKDNFFRPESLTVQRGGSVRWTNDGGVLHSVVQDSGAWQSPLLQRTSWFDVRFDSLGTFNYHCSLHPEITGTVIVQ